MITKKINFTNNKQKHKNTEDMYYYFAISTKIVADIQLVKAIFFV